MNNILEIGCSNGSRLQLIKEKLTEYKFFGIDPSREAIEEGKKKYGLNLQVGTADFLPFEDSFFSIIVFGFSLYLCDRKDLFKIASETDRCLCDNGYLIIKDFQPPFPYKNDYKHLEGIFSYKMDYSRMFSWNPVYTEIFNTIFNHSKNISMENPDERVGIKVLLKNSTYAYPDKIQWGI
jgi:ubiquinone/menaquinone biosynthesis C-methylase UbiE